MTAIALDTNLLLLLIVGTAIGDVVGKRLKSYSRQDWDSLQSYLVDADQLISTPNVWTEVSNICTYGIHKDWHRKVHETLASTINGAVEIVRASRVVAANPEFSRLGLTDCVWLSVLDDNRDTVLLTDDLPLYHFALSHGFKVKNFNHLRDLV